MPRPSLSATPATALRWLLVAMLLLLFTLHPTTTQAHSGTEGIPTLSQLTANWKTLSGNGVNFHYPPELESWAQFLAAEHPRAVAMLENEWLLDLPPQITVTLCPGAECLSEALNTTIPRHYLGLAVPSRHTVLLNTLTTLEGGPDRLRGTYLHELVHLAVSYHPERGWMRVPRWFDEGTAMVISKTWDLNEAWNIENLRILQTPLSDLDAQFGKDPIAMQDAYTQSHSLVRHFTDQHGAVGLRRLLVEMRGGAPFHQAFFAASGQTLAEFWASWDRTQNSLGAWVLALSNTVMLWMSIGVLALLAALVHRRYRQRKQQQLELEDEADDLRASSKPPQPLPLRLVLPVPYAPAPSQQASSTQADQPLSPDEDSSPEFPPPPEATPASDEPSGLDPRRLRPEDLLHLRSPSDREQ